MRGLRIVAILVLLFLLAAVTVRAVPPLPSTFWGVFTMNGARLSLSAELVAYVDDVACGRAHLYLYQGTTYYSISVKGDDPEMPGKECGVSGDTIRFRLNGAPLATTAIWAGGTMSELPIVETSAHRTTATERLFLPAVANEYWPPVVVAD